MYIDIVSLKNDTMKYYRNCRVLSEDQKGDNI